MSDANAESPGRGLFGRQVAGVVRLDHLSAGRLTDQIRAVLASVQEQVDQLVRLLEEARGGAAHLALGYRSWTEYAEREFGQVPLRLPKEDRQELVVRLAEMGMSARAIAPVVGAGLGTVGRDMAGVPNGTPDGGGPASGGEDRGTRNVARDSGSGVAQGSAVAAREGPTESRRVTTGRDGKEYAVRPKSKSRAEQKKKEGVADGSDRQPSTRRSRTKVVAVMSKVVLSATDAAFAAEELKREHFKQRKEEATRWARDLDSAIQSLQRLADLLKEQTE